MTWHLIDTAPAHTDESIIAARFREGCSIPDYVVSARYGTAFPIMIQCASYSGFFVDGVPIESPPRKGSIRLFGIVSRDTECAPTHWMEIPKP